MSTSASLNLSAHAEPTPRHAPGQAGASSRLHDGWIYLILAFLAAGAWWLTSLKLFTPGSDAGYWIGVVGGTTMLGVFAYPMRKHFRFMQRWGAAKYWFVVHMMVGIVGPLLILVHSTFHVGSINGGVALFSMLVVMFSGVVGRFLYVRLHRDLHGHKLSLEELRRHVAGDEMLVAKLKFAPVAQKELLAFEQHALAQRGSVWRVMLGSWGLTLRRWSVQRRVRTELRIGMMARAQAEQWSRRSFRRRLRAARALADDFLLTTQRLAEFTAWEKLFSLWHVAHVPFVYMMVLSAVAHVVAVHAY